MIWSFRLQVAPGGVELRPRRAQEVRGSPELQNGGLRSLKEAWDNVLIEAVSCQVWLVSVLLGRLQVAPGGVQLRLWRSEEVRGSLACSTSFPGGNLVDGLPPVPSSPV